MRMAMTRLRSADIAEISAGLKAYDEELISKTGKTLRGIACYAVELNEEDVVGRISHVRIGVVPVHWGHGLIGGFSETTRDILNHIGFQVFVTKESDVTGLSEAVDKHADIIFMADDNCFVALNLECRRVVHNADATGKGFLAGLNLMAGGLQGQAVLVIGGGAVGSSAARALLNYDAKISVYDSDHLRSRELARILDKKFNIQIKIETELKSGLAQHRFWVEATNSANIIHGHDLTPTTYIAAPGMPLGLSRDATHKVSRRIIHDPLQIGVATMGLEALKQTLTENGF